MEFEEESKFKEPEDMDDDELIIALRETVANANVLAYHLAVRKMWVQFAVKARSQFPRKHDPNAVEITIWKAVE